MDAPDGWTSKPPRIFYFCYSHDRPTGGQKHTYTHVDILNRCGFDAMAFHPTDDFRLTWFDNATRVIGMSEFRRRHDPVHDYVVLPEDLGDRIADFPGRKVVFDKNVFHGCTALGALNSRAYPYRAKDVVAVLTVSDHNRQHVEYAYPHQLVRVVHPAIREEVFSWRPLSDKRPQIACIPKNPEWLRTLYHTIQARAAAGLNSGNRFQWKVLGDVSERETAAVLQESLLFVFLSVTEGLGRMPLEAMACGCLVAAWRAGPLRETLPERVRFEFGTVLDMARFIEEVMDAYPDRVDQWRPLAEAGRDLARSYSVERQDRSVIDAWTDILRAQQAWAA
jgi:hypothetical protein